MFESYYEVSPRYTSGSPALVDEKTAKHIAVEEGRAYALLIENPSHVPEDFARARKLGLSGIVFSYHDSRFQRHYHDLITGKIHTVDLVTLRKQQASQ